MKGNNINISYKKDRNNNKIKEDFKEYLNSIPDDIFVDACNLFTKEFGISMNDLNKLLDGLYFYNYQIFPTFFRIHFLLRQTILPELLLSHCFSSLFYPPRADRKSVV